MQVQFRGNRTAHKWLVCMLLVLERVLAFDMSISGKLSSYTLYGFNNKRYDPSKFIYPAGSYTSLLAEMNVSMDLYKGLHAEVGGMLSALPYDSTAYQGNDIQPGQPGGPGDFYNHDGGIYWEYIGWYAGHSGLHVQKPRYAMVNNAYISYDYKGIFGIKGGVMSFPITIGSPPLAKAWKAMSNTRTINCGCSTRMQGHLRLATGFGLLGVTTPAASP